MESYTMERNSVILIATVLQSVTLTTLAVTIDLGNINRGQLANGHHSRSLQATDHRSRPLQNVHNTPAADRTAALGVAAAGRRLQLPGTLQQNYYHHRSSADVTAVQQRGPTPVQHGGAASHPPPPDWTPIAATPLQLQQNAVGPTDELNNNFHRQPEFVTFVTPSPPVQEENPHSKDLRHQNKDADDGRGTKDDYYELRSGNDNPQYANAVTENVGLAGANDQLRQTYDLHGANDLQPHRKDNAQHPNPNVDGAARSEVQPAPFGYVNEDAAAAAMQVHRGGEKHRESLQNDGPNYIDVVDGQTVPQQQRPSENYVLQSSDDQEDTLNHADADVVTTANEGEVSIIAAEDSNTYEDERRENANLKFDGLKSGAGDGHEHADGSVPVAVAVTGRTNEAQVRVNENQRTSGQDPKNKHKRRGGGEKDGARKGTTAAGRRRRRPNHSAATADNNYESAAVAQSHRVHQIDRNKDIGGSSPSIVAAVVPESSDAAVPRQRRRKVQSSSPPTAAPKRRNRPSASVVAAHKKRGDDDGSLHRMTTDDGQNGSEKLVDHGEYARRSTTPGDTSKVATSNRRQTPEVVQDEGTTESIEKTTEEQVLGGYGFGYTVLDEYIGMDFGQWERREPGPFGTVTGQYRVRLPDGRTQTVEYSANANTGYRALVTYEGVQHHPAPSSVPRYDSDADETSSD